MFSVSQQLADDDAESSSLSSYTKAIGCMGMSVFDNISMKNASACMGVNSSKPSDVLCKNLIAADRGGSSDPYFIFKVNGKEVYKSEVVKKTLNPEYDDGRHTSPVRSAASPCIALATAGARAP